MTSRYTYQLLRSGHAAVDTTKAQVVRFHATEAEARKHVEELNRKCVSQ